MGCQYVKKLWILLFNERGKVKKSHNGFVVASQTSKKYNLLFSFFAFLLWGSWAFFTNRKFGMTTRVISGVKQGIFSFLITLLIIRIVTLLFHLLDNNPLRLILPALMTVSCSGIFLTLAHRMVGTPRIGHTIFPVLAVSFLFCIYTTIKLYRSS